MRRTLVFTSAALALLLAATPARSVPPQTLFAPTGIQGELLGSSVAPAGDVNGDGFADVIVGAKFSDVGGEVMAGRARIYYGGPGADAIAELTLTGEAELDQFGYSVSSAGDVNGDGFGDVIVGAISSDVAEVEDAGRAYVYFGGPSANAVADLTLTGTAGSLFFGVSVSSAGDLNDDGFDDVIVGAHGSDGGGRAFVYFGGPTANAVADLTLTAEAPGDNFGISVASAGDLNGDGFDDVIVGAQGSDAGGADAGRAYVYHGGPGADAVADLVLTGDSADDALGKSVASAGDVNGDGFDDLIIGAFANHSGRAGRAHVYFGGPGADANADLTLTGVEADDRFGGSVASAGDVNGDGHPDLIVGAYTDDSGGANAGRIYVYHGGPEADAVAELILIGETAGDQLGFSVASAGDVDGDGLADAVVGTNQVAGSWAGYAYVMNLSERVGVVGDGPVSILELAPPFPNPLRGGAALEIRFRLREDDTVQMELVNARGRRVAVHSAGRRIAGQEHAVSWNPGPLPSGVYFLRLSGSRGEAAEQRIAVLR